jgi:hypothetical protein
MRKHVFLTNFIRVPRDETEANVWYQFLGTPEERQSNTCNRVALWHFFPLDIKILKPSSLCNDLLYEEIDFTDITCHDDLGRSNNKVSPPQILCTEFFQMILTLL